MATKTTNYELVKPAFSDSPDITAMNVNWDTIDTQMKLAADARGIQVSNHSLPAGADLNTVVISGIYRVGDSPVNAPDNLAYGILQVCRGPASSDTIFQIYVNYDTGWMYKRAGVINNRWTTWSCIDRDIEAKISKGSLSKKITNPASPTPLDQYIAGLRAEVLYFTGNKGSLPNLTGIPGDIANDYMVTVMGGNTYGDLYYATITVESMIGSKVKYFGQIYNSGTFTGWLKVLTTNDDYRPNLLINGDFQVWQRGNLFNNPNGVYTADRWKIDNNADANIKVMAVASFAPGYGLHLSQIGATGVAGAMTQISQSIENYLSYVNKPITVTATVSCGMNYVRLFVTDGNQVIASPEYGNGFHKISATITPSYYGGYLKVFLQVGRSGSPVGSETYVYDIKAEANDHATPNIPRPYAEELAMCKRYYQILGTADLHIEAMSNNARLYGPFPVKMRVAPTVIFLKGTIGYNIVSDGILTGGTLTGVSNVYGSATPNGISAIFLTHDAPVMGHWDINSDYILATSDEVALDAEM